MRHLAFAMLLITLASAPALAQDRHDQEAAQGQPEQGSDEEVATPPGPDPCPTGDARCLAREVRALRAEVARARLDHVELAKTLEGCTTMLQGYGETQKELVDLYEGLAASLDRVERKLAGGPAGHNHAARPPVARPRSP
jgi:hypothetical protein